MLQRQQRETGGGVTNSGSERETDRQTDRETDRPTETDRHRETQGQRETHRDTETDTDRHRQTDTETDRQSKCDQPWFSGKMEAERRMELCLSSTWLSSVTSSTAWVTFTSTTLTTGSKTGWQVTTRHTQLSLIIRLAMSVLNLVIILPTATRKWRAAPRIKPANEEQHNNQQYGRNTRAGDVHCQLQLLFFT